MEMECRIPEGRNEWVVNRNVCYSLMASPLWLLFVLIRGREVVERSYEPILWFRGQVDLQDSSSFAEMFVPYTVHSGTTDDRPECQVQNRGHPIRLAKKRRKGNLELRFVLRVFGSLSRFQSPDQLWRPPSRGSYPGAKATCELLWPLPLVSRFRSACLIACTGTTVSCSFACYFEGDIGAQRFVFYRVTFLNAFAKLRKATVSSVMYLSSL